MRSIIQRTRGLASDVLLKVRVFRLLVWRRTSYRGGALLAFAFLDFGIAYSLSAPGSLPNTESYRVISLISYQVWAALWFLVGCICAVQAFAKHNDAYGFAAASLIKFVWSFGFLAAWLAYNAYRAWVGALMWLVFALFVLLIAGWPDPIKQRDRNSGRSN